MSDLAELPRSWIRDFPARRRKKYELFYLEEQYCPSLGRGGIEGIPSSSTKLHCYTHATRDRPISGQRKHDTNAVDIVGCSCIGMVACARL